ncbi:alpha/beta fold hydrolase [Lentzea sp. NPDC058450]|uniref:alpha/beta fold hydrolase n=1 Tax=Lentzea sp. NPDC058450 TaxID=3346505 RepID=UPI0036577125
MSPAEPLVLLPGMNCSPRLWPPLPAVHGRLDRPTLDGCVDALLDDLPDRFALAGLSLGGIVAMALVRRAPSRVTRLCLMSTNARGPTEQQREAWATQREALAAGTTAREVQRALLPVLLHTRTSALDELALTMASEVGEETLDRQLALQATRVDERPGLAAIRVPTLVVSAARDRLCPVARHEEIHALVPGSRLVVLEGIGHLAPLEDPAGVGEVLERWFSAG